jgi:type II secretory pathway pseudopilin PulG
VTGRPAARDGGETLVEILVTVVILGIATAGVTGGLLAVGETSHLQRQQVLAQHALRSWAEQIGVGTYTACATKSGFAAPSPALPTGLAASVTSVQYWDGADFTGSCGTDTGIQRVTLKITATNGLVPPISHSVAVVVRKPCASAC